jgi:hypothetical protein
MTARTHAVMVTYGRKETEKLVLEADSVAAMTNEDGSITIDLCRDHGSSLRIRINKSDAAANALVFKRWGRQ